MIDEFFVLAASNLSVANNGHRNIQYLLRSVGKKAHSRKYHKFRMQTYWFWLSSKQRQQQACKLANYPYRVELWTVKLSDPPPISKPEQAAHYIIPGWLGLSQDPTSICTLCLPVPVVPVPVPVNARPTCVPKSSYLCCCRMVSGQATP